MTNCELSFHIKRTNKHFYLFIRNTTTQIITLSTDSRIVKQILLGMNRKELPIVLGSLFAYKLITSGINHVSFAQRNKFHGKIATIIASMRKSGILVG